MSKYDREYKNFGIKEVSVEELREEAGNIADTMEEIAEDVFDKTFEEWVLVGTRKAPKGWKTKSGKEATSGYVGYKTKDGNAEDEKTSIAMLLLNVAEAVNETPEDTEAFLHALYKTACQLHKHQDDDDDEEEEYKGSGMSLEDAKTHVLKGFLDVAVDSFETFKGKKDYIETCLATCVTARLLTEADADVKREVRKQMKRAQRGDIEGNLVWEQAQALLKVVDDTMDMMDDGRSVDDILEMFKEYTKNRKTNHRH